MKVAIHDSDGRHRGGVVDLGRVSKCLVWPGPPHPDYRETLVDYSGHDRPSTEKDWLLLRMSYFPELTGSRDDDNLQDVASHALRLTPPEAVRWFERQGVDPPPDLLRLARCWRGRGDHRLSKRGGGGCAVEAVSLSATQQRVWGALEGRRMIAKHLAKRVYGNVNKSDAVRKHIEAIRKSGLRIEHSQPEGYWRPDAPPPELVNSHELTVKPRLFRACRPTLVVPNRTAPRKEARSC